MYIHENRIDERTRIFYVPHPPSYRDLCQELIAQINSRNPILLFTLY